MALLYAGASYNEIADLLGISVGTVRTTYTAAKRALATLLNDHGGMTR